MEGQPAQTEVARRIWLPKSGVSSDDDAAKQAIGQRS